MFKNFKNESLGNGIMTVFYFLLYLSFLPLLLLIVAVNPLSITVMI